MKPWVLLAASLFAASACASEPASSWKDLRSGQPVADTESRRAKDGFGGSLLVVTDADWEAKWNTPTSTVPTFNPARDIGKGQRVFALVFFANALPDSRGAVDVGCDIDILKPDGSSALHQAGLACWQGAVLGAPTNTYLSRPVVEFSGDPPDPVGDWVLRVTLTDKVRHTTLALKTSFHLH
jgi:ABC-type amino acid transport substrate-binding protein